MVACMSALAATVVVGEALLFARSGSVEAEVTVAVFVRTVPEARPGSTATSSVKIPEPTARDAIEQLIVPPAPTAGVVQLQPPGADSEVNAVPAGRVSLHVTSVAGSGPAFETVIVYVRPLPARTGSGLSALVMETSLMANAATAKYATTGS